MRLLWDCKGMEKDDGILFAADVMTAAIAGIWPGQDRVQAIRFTRIFCLSRPGGITAT
jgi:hypothetical protein